MNNQSYHTDRMNEYPDTLLTTAELGEADVPVTPLPNPGEGGPVDSGGNQNNGANVPVIPLPNPGEGGPVDSGNRPGFPPIFRPIFPGNSGSVTVIPGVTFPCYNCTATSFGRVRILNASTGYQPFYVYLGNWMVASGLGNGDITGYVQSASGTQTVTVSEDRAGTRLRLHDHCHHQYGKRPGHHGNIRHLLQRAFRHQLSADLQPVAEPGALRRIHRQPELLLYCVQQCTLQGSDPLHQLLSGVVPALHLQDRLLSQHLSGNHLRQHERQYILHSVYLQCPKRNGWAEDAGGVQLNGNNIKKPYSCYYQKASGKKQISSRIFSQKKSGWIT